MINDKNDNKSCQNLVRKKRLIQEVDEFDQKEEKKIDFFVKKISTEFIVIFIIFFELLIHKVLMT